MDVEPWTEPQTVTVSHPWWTPPDPVHGVTFGLAETVPFTWTLRPPDDAVANGGFEAGLDNWTTGSAEDGTAASVTDPVHTGHQALSLSGPPPGSVASMPQGIAASASQTVDLAEAWEPVLSLWYQPGPAALDPTTVFNVSITTETAVHRQRIDVVSDQAS